MIKKENGYIQTMTRWRVVIILLSLLFPQTTIAWDGCENYYGWKCGDLCIHYESDCKCGGQTFNHTNQTWCCRNSTSSCTGKGQKGYGDVWYGEKQEGRMIGAECNGAIKHLTEACHQKCNNYESDPKRNFFGVLRGFVPCNHSWKNAKTHLCYFPNCLC